MAFPTKNIGLSLENFIKRWVFLVHPERLCWILKLYPQRIPYFFNSTPQEILNFLTYPEEFLQFSIRGGDWGALFPQILYEDQSGEFICWYWGLEGYTVTWAKIFISFQLLCFDVLTLTLSQKIIIQQVQNKSDFGCFLFSTLENILLSQ